MLSVFLAFSLWTLIFLLNSLECESSLIVVFPACLSVRVTRTSSYQAMTAQTSSTLCSAYTHAHRSTTCCLVGRIVPFGSGAVWLLATGLYLVGDDDVILWTRH